MIHFLLHGAPNPRTSAFPRHCQRMIIVLQFRQVEYLAQALLDEGLSQRVNLRLRFRPLSNFLVKHLDEGRRRLSNHKSVLCPAWRRLLASLHRAQHRCRNHLLNTKCGEFALLHWTRLLFVGHLGFILAFLLSLRGGCRGCGPVPPLLLPCVRFSCLLNDLWLFVSQASYASLLHLL